MGVLAQFQTARFPSNMASQDASDNPSGRVAAQTAKISVTFAKPFKSLPMVAVP